MKNETKLAILESNMAELKTEVAEIKGDVKAIGSQLQIIINTKITDHVQMQSQINDLRAGQKRLEAQSNLWRWLSPTLSALFSAGITFLFISYLQHLK